LTSPAPGTRLGPYEITAKLGEGGMGEVYRATDSKLKREVAIKVLPAAFTNDPERLARFEREAQLLAQLHHPHIASIFGLEESGGVRALVMELVDGPTLADRLAQGSLPVEESLTIARQIAEALEAAHEKGIVHRDLKPQNVKIALDGTVKVLDFGLAKAMDSAGGSSAADAARSPTLMNSPTLTAAGTQLGVILGTAAYMAPEQARGGVVDKRADIWAFGVVLYEMLVGRSLFAGDTVTDTLAGVLKTEIDFSRLPAALSTELRRLLRRCLERNPKNRLHDIADARIALDEMGSGFAESVAPVAPPAAVLPAWKRILPWALALVGIGLGAIGILARRPAAVPTGASLPTTRFTVAVPAPGEIQGYPALSPDGRSLAFSFVPEHRIARLWVHSFDSGKGRELQATEHAADPFWSPDGRQLGFFAAGELRRVEVASGLVQSIARVSDARGGAWSDNGEILYSPTSSSALMRVAASGGAARPATQLVPGEQSHRFPWVLPGGEAVLFFTLSGKDMGLNWLSLRSGERKLLLPDNSRGAYDPRGYLLWNRQGTLVGQHFDPVRGELSGEVFVVAEKISMDPQKTSQAWFGVASGSVAVRAGEFRQSHLAWFDRRGGELGEVTRAGSWSEPALSPDDRRVAVIGSQEEAWVFETSGKDRGLRLSFEGRRSTPAWSTDGVSIFYEADLPEGKTIVRKRADGSGSEEVVYRSSSSLWPDSESPREPLLVVEGKGADTGYGLWLLPLAGERRLQPFQQSANGSQAKASFSPDGTLLAYTSDESGLSQIYVQPLRGSGERWQVTSDGGDHALWRADGKELYYVGLDRVLRAVPVRSLAPFAAGPPEELFPLRIPQPAPTGWRTFYAPSRDGQRFLVNDHLDSAADPGIEVILNWSPPATSGGASGAVSKQP
jgi:Tol biopolymer transport system component